MFIDLKKAFDTCNFDILLAKLKHNGIRGTEQAWFRSYLSNRQQYVDINGNISSLETLPMGIPQGSVAGPILFLVFINDLPNASDLFTILFADNTTLQCNSSCLHTLYSTVNYNLKLIERWFSANLLTLNTKKPNTFFSQATKNHYLCHTLLLC